MIMMFFNRTDKYATRQPRPTMGDIGGGLLAAWRILVRRRKLRATERTLLALSDQTLKDIGVHRSEIHTLVFDGDGRPRNQTWPVNHRYY